MPEDTDLPVVAPVDAPIPSDAVTTNADAGASSDAVATAASSETEASASTVEPGTVAPAEPAVAEPAVAEPFLSLYGSPSTTVIAILLGGAILVAIQLLVQRMFSGAKSSQSALTSFATSMCAVLVGIYAADMLVAGPNVELLSEPERLTVLTFVKDITLTVFAFYFGTQASAAMTKE